MVYSDYFAINAVHRMTSNLGNMCAKSHIKQAMIHVDSELKFPTETHKRPVKWRILMNIISVTFS